MNVFRDIVNKEADESEKGSVKFDNISFDLTSESSPGKYKPEIEHGITVVNMNFPPYGEFKSLKNSADEEQSFRSLQNQTRECIEERSDEHSFVSDKRSSVAETPIPKMILDPKQLEIEPKMNSDPKIDPFLSILKEEIGQRKEMIFSNLLGNVRGG